MKKTVKNLTLIALIMAIFLSMTLPAVAAPEDGSQYLYSNSEGTDNGSTVNEQEDVSIDTIFVTEAPDAVAIGTVPTEDPDFSANEDTIIEEQTRGLDAPETFEKSIPEENNLCSNLDESTLKELGDFVVLDGDIAYLYDPSSDSYLPIRDMRNVFQAESVDLPPEEVSDHWVDLPGESTKIIDMPVPGGVGYGFFFNSDYRDDYTTGTSISYDIICPTSIGGNSSNWLYLTSTNRAAKGVEAFILYYGQNDFAFRVFDWARPEDERFQCLIESSTLLSDYIRTKTIHGTTRQYLTVQNTTLQTGTNTWANYVWLNCSSDNSFDLVYSYSYTATLSDQQGQWVGSWGPIVETFQDSYSGTNTAGFYQTFLRTKDSAWSGWEYLTTSHSYVRDDDKGFSLVFLDPNHGFAVDS